MYFPWRGRVRQAEQTAEPSVLSKTPPLSWSTLTTPGGPATGVDTLTELASGDFGAWAGHDRP